MPNHQIIIVYQRVEREQNKETIRKLIEAMEQEDMRIIKEKQEEARLVEEKRRKQMEDDEAKRVSL